MEVAILQAKYRDEIGRFENAWESGQIPFRFDASAVSELVDELVRFQDRTRERVEVLNNEQQVSGASDLELDALQRRMENASLHANYLIGWTSFFESLARPQEKLELLNRAENSFREFFQIDAEKPVRDLEGRWLDLDSGWNSLGIIGWAMCRESLGHFDDSAHLFNLVKSGRQRSLGSILPIFELKSKIYAGRYNEALSLLDGLESAPETTPSELTPIWFAAFKLSQGLPDSAVRIRTRIGKQSLVGLLRASQIDALESLVNQFKPTFVGDDFFGLWVHGVLEANRAGNDSKALIEARRILERAVSLATADDAASDIARCEFFIGQIFFRNREYVAAAEHFRLASEAMENEPDFTAESLWMHAQSLAKQSLVDSQFQNTAFIAMDNLIRRFPDSPWVSKAEFARLRMEASALPPREAIRRFHEIRPGSSDYPEALFESLRAQYRVWLDAHNRKTDGEEAERQQLETMELSHRSLDGVSPERKLLGVLMVLDSELRRNKPDQERVLKFLGAAEGISKTVSAGSDAFVEFRYYQFLVAKKTESGDATKWANWIVQHSTQNRFKESALIFLARNIDERLGAEPDSLAAIREAIGIYRRLSEIYGTDEKNLRQSRNAQFAYKRLAESYLRAGQWSEAARAYQGLTLAFPGHSDFLIGLATANMKLQNYAQAKPIWSRLASGSEAGTSDWFAAKIGLIQCLAKTDAGEARKVLRQTRNLSPNPPREWSEKLSSLEKLLEKATSPDNPALNH